MRKIISLIGVIYLSIVGITAQNFELLSTQSAASGVESLILTPDGNHMISGHLNGMLQLWDIKTMTVEKTIKAHGGQIASILFDKKGERFVTSSEDGRVCLFEYPAFKMIKAFNVPNDNNSFAVISTDGKSIYFGGSDYSREYDTETGKYKDPYAPLYKISINGNGKAEVAFNNESIYNYHNITDGNIDFDGEYVVFTQDEDLHFFNQSKNRLEYKVRCPHGLNNITPVKNVIYAWGDRYLMKLEKSGDRYVLSKSVLAGTRGVSFGYSKMVLSADGEMLVTGDDGSNVNIWDKNLNKLQSLSGHSDLVRNFLWWNNDSVLITAGYDGNFLVWGYKKEQKDSEVVIIEEPEVIFSENNIPVKIKDRDVELQRTITVSNTEFDIQIWDRSVVDGDSISLNLNGEWLLTEYMVVKAKKTLHVKINPSFSNNYLILYAHNLGSISPNTAAVSVVVDGKEYKLTLNSDLDKSGALNFEYKPK